MTYTLPTVYQAHWLRFVNRQQTQPLSDSELQALEAQHSQVQDLHLQLDQVLFEQRSLRRQLQEQASQGNTQAQELLKDLAQPHEHPTPVASPVLFGNL